MLLRAKRATYWGDAMTCFHRYHAKTIILCCTVLLLMLTSALGSTSCGDLVSITEQDVASATVVVLSVGSEGFVETEYPIDLAEASKRTELVAAMNTLEKDDWGSTEGMFKLFLEVNLVDGKQYRVIWWDNDRLKLKTIVNEEDQERIGTGVESAEMSAFLAPYLEYR